MSFATGTVGHIFNPLYTPLCCTLRLVRLKDYILRLEIGASNTLFSTEFFALQSHLCP